MAFELAKINPTSVPINLLNPRPGTKFGDRELMDPWEVVKWIAIFRLDPARGAVPPVRRPGREPRRAPGDRRQAGLNGVMMGNFLTTLGNTPDEDRAMFEELGLNVARQPDNGANPRPDNRSGWLEGETPDVVERGAGRGAAGGARGPAVGSDDAAAVRGQAHGPSAPDGAPNSGQGRETREAAARRARRLRLSARPRRSVRPARALCCALDDRDRGPA